MHPGNFGSDKIVLIYVRTSCKPGWNFAFQALARLGGKSHGHSDFRKKKYNNNNNNKADSSLRLNFDVYINVDNRKS